MRFASALIGLAMVSSANAAVIINEVYPGGGSSVATTTYNRDFVEIYNTGASTVDLSGWRVSYASAGGNYGTNNVVAFGTGSYIGAGDYLLLVSGGAGSAGVVVPAANYYNGGIAGTSGASLSGTAGSVSIFDASNVRIDTLGYGSTVTSPDANGVVKIEGTAAAALASGNNLSYNRSGFVDTNNNSADFTAATPSPTPGINSQVVVPEPTSLAVLGLAGLVRARRRA